MKKSLLAVSIAAATGLGVSQNATADVYAYAFNEVLNLTIACSTNCIPTSTTFSLSDSANLSPGGTDANGQNFTSGVAPFNIPDANVGIAGSTSFGQNGNIGNNYVRADATIITSELNPGGPPNGPQPSGNTTRVQAVAESYLNTDAGGQATGSTGSVSSFTFIAPAGTTLSFEFDAILNLIACVEAGGTGVPPLPPATCGNSGAVFASDAQAQSTVTLVITDSFGVKVFDWSPGSGSGTGIAASVNPFNLNTQTSRNQSVPGFAQVTGDTTGALPAFSASSVALDAGTYTLALTDTKKVVTNLTNAAAVPEPGTLALMGMGLLGAFLNGRRRQGCDGKAA